MKKIILSTFVASSFLFAGDFTNSIGMVFKEIPSGSFLMGTATPNCPKDNPYTSQNEYEDCMSDIKKETPQHKVFVDGFYMQESEVTQGQWYEVMGDNPADFKTGDANMPVEHVSWDDAKRFINKLNTKEKTDKYRLPTEEEWEYAARAGTTTKWYCGDNESCVSSIAVTGTSSPKPVKSKKPNAWGLYDMSGNVWEWTDSCWRDDYNSEKKCDRKVIRGGSWTGDASATYSAFRGIFIPDVGTLILGFRLLRMI